MNTAENEVKKQTSFEELKNAGDKNRRILITRYRVARETYKTMLNARHGAICQNKGF